MATRRPQCRHASDVRRIEQTQPARRSQSREPAATFPRADRLRGALGQPGSRASGERCL